MLHKTFQNDISTIKAKANGKTTKLQLMFTMSLFVYLLILVCLCSAHNLYSLEDFTVQEKPTSDRILNKSMLVNFLKKYFNANETFISIVIGSTQSSQNNQNEFVHDLFSDSVLCEFAFHVEPNLNLAQWRKKSFYVLIVDDSKSLE